MPVSSSNHSVSRPRFTVFIQEFVTNSGLFWIFDALRVLTTEGVRAYFSWPHLFLLIGSLLQTYVLSRSKDRYAWANFIALIFYGTFDVLLEGTEFFTQPYHIYLAIYSATMALMYALRRHHATIAALGEAIVRTSLLGGMYMLAEWDKLPNHPSLQSYWLDDPGHLYILFASLLFGILLGISVIARNRLETMLQALTNHLAQITNWIFDPQLVMESFKDSQRLSLKRVERTILFMDIRGFTTWSEQHDPAEVVSMLNEYYSMAEEVIDAHHGFKIQLTADEIMTRFSEPDTALSAAC
ncbi:partial Adenylate cyclase 1, partial [Anaerolineae bacterium]